MKILATVNMGPIQITQHWECLEDDEDKYITVMELKNGKRVSLMLEGSRVQPLKTGPEDFTYTGNLDIKDAILIPD